MFRMLLILGLVGFGITPTWAQATARLKDDAKRLDGVWRPVEAKLSGQPLPESTLESMQLTMKAGRYSTKVGDTVDQGEFTLSVRGDTKQMDIIGGDGPNKDKKFLAIYELDGDTLRICYDLEGKSRPEGFKTEKSKLQFCVTYRRDRP